LIRESLIIPLFPGNMLISRVKLVPRLLGSFLRKGDSDLVHKMNKHENEASTWFMTNLASTG